jgi:fermentation-respiration switch protein FrsA (DUF1100 family)
VEKQPGQRRCLYAVLTPSARNQAEYSVAGLPGNRWSQMEQGRNDKAVSFRCGQDASGGYRNTGRRSASRIRRSAATSPLAAASRSSRSSEVLPRNVLTYSAASGLSLGPSSSHRSRPRSRIMRSISVYSVAGLPGNRWSQMEQGRNDKAVSFRGGQDASGPS